MIENKLYESLKDLTRTNTKINAENGIKVAAGGNLGIPALDLINKDIEIHNGTYGYYIKYKKKNYAIRKNKKNEEEYNRYIEEITEEECMKIIKKK